MPANARGDVQLHVAAREVCCSKCATAKVPLAPLAGLPPYTRVPCDPVRM